MNECKDIEGKRISHEDIFIPDTDNCKICVCEHGSASVSLCLFIYLPTHLVLPPGADPVLIPSARYVPPLALQNGALPSAAGLQELRDWHGLLRVHLHGQAVQHEPQHCQRLRLFQHMTSGQWRGRHLLPDPALLPHQPTQASQGARPGGAPAPHAPPPAAEHDQR